MAESTFIALFAAIMDGGLGKNEKIVALGLLRHWSRKGTVFPSITRLAKLGGLSRSSVLRALECLESLELIKVTRAHGVPNRYELSGLLEPVSQGHQSQGDTSIRETPNQSHPDTKLVSPRHPKKSIKKSKKNTRETHSTKTTSSRRRATQEDVDAFQPTDAHRELAKSKGADVADVLRAFKIGAIGYEYTVRGLPAAFTRWVKRERGAAPQRFGGYRQAGGESVDVDEAPF